MSNTKDFVIENGILIKYIGAGGDVVIPVGVAEIASFAFNPYLDGIAIKHYDGRKNIKSVVIPEGVVKIGKSAFANCENLEKITAPQSLTKVEANAFFRTAWQEKQNGFITLNSVLVAYSGDDSEVIIPEGITAIADGVFESHREITSVQIPQTVTSIGSQAFCRCEALREIHIPESVAEIGHQAFDATPWLEAHTEDFVIINNILYKYQGQNAIVQIPNTIHMIGPYAFGFHKTVESVTIPDSVMQIKASAFSGCKKLKSVAIPAGIEELENNVFFGCNSLTEIFCSGNLKRIGTSTFYGCEKLTQFPDMTGVESIGEEAFFGCQMLADQKGRIIVNGILFGYDNPGRIIEIPNEVSYISSGAFEDTKYAFVNTEEVEQIVAPEAVFAQVWGLLKPANKQAVALNCLRNDTLYEVVKAYIKKSKDKAQMCKCHSIITVYAFQKAHKLSCTSACTCIDFAADRCEVIHTDHFRKCIAVFCNNIRTKSAFKTSVIILMDTFNDLAGHTRHRILLCLNGPQIRTYKHAVKTELTQHFAHASRILDSLLGQRHLRCRHHIFQISLALAVSNQI